MRVLVTGSRDWDDADVIHADLWAYQHLHDVVVLVHGACPTGADAIAAAFWDDMELLAEPHPADWERYGKRAGFLRNAQMVALGADLCYAYIKNNSRGASMTARLAEKAGILVVRRVDPVLHLHHVDAEA